jgi:hypothetical protein
MRLPDLMLVGSIVVAAVSLVFWGTRRWSGEDGPRRSADQVLTVRSALDPDYVTAVPVETGELHAGAVRFVLGDGERLRGVQGASLFPERDGAPYFARWTETASAQTDSGLDLRHWMAKVQPTGVQLLQFNLLVERDEGVESRVGWARLDPSVLAYAALDVPAPRLHVTDVLVETGKGQPVPGALVAVDVELHETTPWSLFAFTGEDGRARVTGLSDRMNWVARLPDGVGPHTESVESPFSVPRDEVRLRVPLLGEWEFTRHAVRLPLRGASLRLTEFRGTGHMGVAAWPVSTWVGPGRGPDIPFHVMRRRGVTRGTPAEFVFEGFEPFTVGDVTRPTAMEFDRVDRRFVVSALGQSR